MLAEPDEPRRRPRLRAEDIALLELMTLDERYADSEQAWAHLVVKSQQWGLTPIEASRRLCLAAIKGLDADW